MLLVGSCYIRKEGKVDRAGVLHDLCAAEVMINVEKRCTSTPQMCWSRMTAQRITDVTATCTTSPRPSRGGVSAPISDPQRQTSGNRNHLGGII